jgi:sec-independent protein translocase protein TatC
MDDDKQGAPPPQGEESPQAPPGSETYGTYRDEYAFDPARGIPAPAGSEPVKETAVAVATASGGSITPPAPPAPPADPEDEEESNMLRMSFMEHLEELRTRIIRALMGLAVAFVVSILYCFKLWEIIEEPAVEALKSLKVDPPQLVQTTPMEGFSIIWVKLPLLCSVFLASPWVVYQLWAFISPGLYRREKRWAAPFVLLTGGLFIAGGCFAYFLAFRYGLTFLLGIGMTAGVRPMVTITEYFDLFVNVTLGVGLVFELPIVIFTLTLLRLASPRFLLRHSRYAILIIVIIAAIVTPTPDVFNLMLFAVPMCLLYFVGLFAGFLIVFRREGKRMPWKRILMIGIPLVVVLAAAVLAFKYFHVHLVSHWPYLVR